MHPRTARWVPAPLASGPEEQRRRARVRVLLAERGDLSLEALARVLLASERRIPEGLARQVVGAALGWRPDLLPPRLHRDSLALRPGPTAAGRRAIADVDFVVVDLETTGLSASRARILEIGAVRVRSGRLRDRFESLVRPVGGVPARIAALTGIDSEMVARAPRSSDILRRFRCWFARYPDAVFVAHNAPFDAGFLRRELALHGLPPIGAPVVCTRKLARRALPGLRRHDLDRVTRHYGIRNGARHRALGDALATGELLVRLIQTAREEVPLARLADLFAFLDAKPPPRLRDPFPEDDFA